MIHHIKKFIQGKQGVTGLVEKDDMVSVYKITQLMNFIPRHEYTIMKDLECLTPYCPHFCVAYKLKPFEIHSQFTNIEQNPFEVSDESIQLDVLFIEFIKDSVSFTDLIISHNVTFSEIISIIKQVFVAVIMAQDKMHFTHYDLHPSNILLKSCDKNLTHIYVLQDGTILHIPTEGWIPVIIDFGFARTDAVDGKPMYNTLSYTDVGFMYPLFDPIADAKLLLVTICTQLKSTELPSRSDKVEMFRNVVKNIFGSLEINWSTGWDCEAESVIDTIISYVKSDIVSSELFGTYMFYIMDIFQSMIHLPLTTSAQSSLRDFREGLVNFISEFSVIEDTLDDPFYSLYALYSLVDQSRDLLCKDFDDAIEDFKGVVVNVLTRLKIEQLVDSIDVHILLCSMMVIKEQLEAKIVDLLNQRLEIKNKSYDTMPLSSVRDVLAVLDSLFPSDPVSDNVIVYDALNAKSFHLVEEDIKSIQTQGIEGAMEGILDDEFKINLKTSV